ncbi:adenosylcobinamide amidohydrolase [Halorarum halobium]|uniref:adenosylcobinamide amidohydrolase n=1 Tax=Halorarum halobium TaxID=3075121 RepID=UPI0028ACC13D|nr:adenosylcobinamide amidohydrolase [Halobaculum sp. XH14]
MFETALADGVLRLARPGTTWLSTGWDGGFADADAAYNVTVPEGWDRTDLDAYIEHRRERAGFEAAGPTLLTGVEQRHARGARLDPAVAYATAGLSNPAALPMEPAGDGGDGAPESADLTGPADSPDSTKSSDPPDVGTVNVVVGTTRRLDDAGLATLLGVAVEAKTATLLAEAGVPGTTTDAVVVGSDADGEPEPFAGSATAVGAAARACVRDAVRASLQSRYAERARPGSVADAEYGVVTGRRAEVFAP